MSGSNISAAVAADRTSTCALVTDRIRQAGLWGVPGEASSAERTHLVSPEPFELTESQVETLRRLGPALLAFYRAANSLYLSSQHPWVNDYLDRGKPEELLRHARMNYSKRALPGIIRPDILLTRDGMVITELDSVPGGAGHLDCISSAYEDAGFELVGPRRGMRDGFAGLMRSVSRGDDPAVAIVVSDESEDYRPEVRWLARELRAAGLRAWEVHPRDLTFREDGLYVSPEEGELRIDAFYRFFELFDLLNIPKADLIAYAARKKLTAVTPPYKPHLEEKLLLALLGSEHLESYWLDALGEETVTLLRDLVAPTFILDNRPVPPSARIAGFEFRGRPIRDWREIADGTQRERQLVLKPSGFSPLAWGSRGVVVGHDVPAQEWSAAIDEALASFDESPYVLQPFADSEVFGVDYYEEGAGEISEMNARVRLCPYYFADGEDAALAGVLATACPSDKKILHGMVDAVLAPCRLRKES